MDLRGTVSRWTFCCSVYHILHTLKRINWCFIPLCTAVGFQNTVAPLTRSCSTTHFLMFLLCCWTNKQTPLRNGLPVWISVAWLLPRGMAFTFYHNFRFFNLIHRPRINFCYWFFSTENGHVVTNQFSPFEAPEIAWLCFMTAANFNTAGV